MAGRTKFITRRSTVIAKFHYTDPTRTRPDPTGPARTRTDFFCGETPLGPCGPPTKSVRVRVVEFSSYPTTCADFVRVRSVSGPCRVRVRVVEFSSYSTTCADFVRVRSVSGPCRVRVVEFSFNALTPLFLLMVDLLCNLFLQGYSS